MRHWDTFFVLFCFCDRRETKIRNKRKSIQTFKAPLSFSWSKSHPAFHVHPARSPAWLLRLGNGSASLARINSESRLGHTHGNNQEMICARYCTSSHTYTGTLSSLSSLSLLLKPTYGHTNSFKVTHEPEPQTTCGSIGVYSVSASYKPLRWWMAELSCAHKSRQSFGNGCLMLYIYIKWV